MKNKKGFTLVELLAVVLLISILMLIAVPAVMKYMKQGTKSYYHSLEKEMKVSGMDYMETYRGLLPRQAGHVTVVELSELVDNKYIDEVKDEKGDACTGQVAVEKIKGDNYTYHSCLRCNGYYESEEEECSYSELNNYYADSGDYSIVVPGERPFTVNQMDEFVAPLAEVYYKGQLIKNDLEGKPKKLDTSRIGTYEIVYYYHGAVEKIEVEVKDVTGPSATKVVLKYVEKDGSIGKNYKGNWFSGNIYAEYKSNDYTDQGIIGSGVAYYETSQDGETWTKITGKSEIIENEGSYTRYVRAVDASGNPSKPATYQIKIDKTAPTHCSWEGESTEWQPNLNLPAEQRVQSRTIKATCHDDISGCSNETKSKTWTETTSNKNKTLTYDMYDLAGNKTVCTKSVDVYLDKTAPVITAVANPRTLGSQDYNFTSNVTPSDLHSGVASTVCNPASSRKTGTYNVTCTVTDKMGLTASVTFAVKHNYPARYNSRTCRKTQTCYTPKTCEAKESYPCQICSGGRWEPCDPWGTDENGNPKQYFGSTCCVGTLYNTTCERVLYEYSCPQPYDCSYNYDCSYYDCPSGGSLSGTTCYY